ncbi:MAG: hypothetical protein IT455_07830 [Planctomycetes bacterium]|nr:hypothetical protein [Planctomycetota bacterium]
MLPLTPPSHVPDLATAIARYQAVPPTDRPGRYRDEIFPWAAQRLLASRCTHPATALLVIPVGTQPYAPLLAALATPAARVALLVNRVTEPHGDVVAATLRGLSNPDRPEVERFSIGEANSGIDVCKAVDSALFWAGDPWPTDITVDVTGGRKATSAALGALAGLRGFRQVYIEGRQLEPGLFVEETLLVLDDVRAWLQEDSRSTATALFEAGAFPAAIAHFDQLAERVLAGPALGWMRAFAAAATASTATARNAAFAHLAAELPAGPIRGTVEPLAQHGEATAIDAATFVAVLEAEGAWR